MKNKGQEGKVKGEVVMDKVIHHDESPGKRSFDLGMVWGGTFDHQKLGSFLLIAIPHPAVLLIFVGRPAQPNDHGGDDI